MEQKLNEIKEDITEIKLDLKEHMYRTELNEQMLEEFKSKITPLEKAYIGIKWTMGTLIAVGTIAVMFVRIKGAL
jgi:chromosome segregation ATPase